MDFGNSTCGLRGIICYTHFLHKMFTSLDFYYVITRVSVIFFLTIFVLVNSHKLIQYDKLVINALVYALLLFLSCDHIKKNLYYESAINILTYIDNHWNDLHDIHVSTTVLVVWTFLFKRQRDIIANISRHISKSLSNYWRYKKNYFELWQLMLYKHNVLIHVPFLHTSRLQ